MLRIVLRTLVVPPGCVLALAALGLIVWRWRPRLGRALVVIAGVLVWLCATPLFAGLLLTSLQDTPPLPSEGTLPPAQAIVVLSAEADAAPEYGAVVPGRDTLVRMRYGAHLQRRTGLPLLVTGGPPGPRAEPMAAAMQRVLVDDFGARVTWVERDARTTHENAVGSARILAEQGIERVFLVTHAWHMPRARRSFEARGLTVVPAPTGFRDAAWQGGRSLLPRWTAMRDSAYATHEWLGRAVYAVLYD